MANAEATIQVKLTPELKEVFTNVTDLLEEVKTKQEELEYRIRRIEDHLDLP